jgi:uncharacterized protein with GYD domain
MARFLIKVQYTLDGVRGVVAEGGTARKTTVQKAVKAAGGKVESFDFAFGDHDAYVVVSVPDNVTAATLSLAVGAGGGARLSMVPLLTPAEVDEAAAKVGSSSYRAPGA